MKGNTWVWILAGVAVVGLVIYISNQNQQTVNSGSTQQLTPGPDVSGVISPTSNVGTPISNGGSLYPIVDPSTGITYLYDPSNLSINPILDPYAPVGAPLSLPAWAQLPYGAQQNATSAA